MKRLVSAVVAIMLLTIQAQATTNEDKINKYIQNKFVTYLNDSLIGKKEVINYWLLRLNENYRQNQLEDYIVSEPTPDSVVDNAMRMFIQLEQTDLTVQEKIVFVKENRKDLYLYSVDSLNTREPKFEVRYAGDEIVKKNFPNVNTFVDTNRIQEVSNEFYTNNTVTQRELYESLTYYGEPRNLINPLPLTNPEKIISSAFGYRGDLYFGNTNLNNHTGIDLAMPTGTDIVVAQSGTVVKVVISDWGYGRYLLIDHGGYYTLYGHCSKITVQEGMYIKQGDKIAEVGSTGWSTGPHLHFEIISNGEPVNPYPYLVSEGEGKN